MSEPAWICLGSWLGTGLLAVITANGVPDAANGVAGLGLFAILFTIAWLVSL